MYIYLAISLLLIILQFLNPLSETISLRPLDPVFNLLAAEKGGLAGFIVGNVLEVVSRESCLYVQSFAELNQFFDCGWTEFRVEELGFDKA